jgi:hypothetical protein
MHPPEAHDPAGRSDTAQHQRHYFEILHGKLHRGDCENLADGCATMKTPGVFARGRFSFSQDDSSPAITAWSSLS